MTYLYKILEVSTYYCDLPVSSVLAAGLYTMLDLISSGLRSFAAKSIDFAFLLNCRSFKSVIRVSDHNVAQTQAK